MRSDSMKMFAQLLAIKFTFSIGMNFYLRDIHGFFNAVSPSLPISKQSKNHNSREKIKYHRHRRRLQTNLPAKWNQRLNKFPSTWISISISFALRFPSSFIFPPAATWKLFTANNSLNNFLKCICCKHRIEVHEFTRGKFAIENEEKVNSLANLWSLTLDPYQLAEFLISV